MDDLDLYAKIEPIIGFYEEYEELYAKYIDKILFLNAKNVLDIGCGNGRFLRHLKDLKIEHFGIDRSLEMIKRAKSIGVNANLLELSSIDREFECATAIGDVLNYIDSKNLELFFKEIRRVLINGGYFLFDINTLDGFETTDGVMVKDLDDKFLSIEADFDGEILQTNITFFEKNEKNFLKSKAKILQYFHDVEKFKNIDGFEYISSTPIRMFSDIDEKVIVTLRAI